MGIPKYGHLECSETLVQPTRSEDLFSLGEGVEVWSLH
jgi:hypothetical protein